MIPLNVEMYMNLYMSFFEQKDYMDVLENLRLPQFTKDDHKLSYRELNHWSTQGLLFEQNVKGKWRKFNLPELIWIELVKELRLYNYPLTAIKLIKDSVSAPIPNINTVCEKDFLVRSFDEMLKSQVSEEEYKLIIQLQEHKNFIETGISEFTKMLNRIVAPNIFEHMVLESYFLKIQYRFFANYNGQVAFTNELFEHEITKQNFYTDSFTRSNISVSINTLLAKIFEDYSVSSLQAKWHLITPEEEKVLKHLKTEGIKSLTIRFRKDLSIDLLEVRKEMKISESQYIKSLLIKGGFEEIKLITQNGKVVSVEKKQQIKL